MEKPNVVLTKKRDFSEVINATFSFLTQEIKLYAKVIIWYAGLPILIASIAGAFYSGNELSKIFQQMQGTVVDTGPVSNIGMLVVSTLLSFIVYILMSGLTASYMIVYVREGRGNFSAEDVWKSATPLFGQIIALYIIITLAIMLVAAIGFLIIYGLATATGSGIATAILIFFGMIVLFIVPVMYISIPLSMAHMSLYDYQKGIIDSIKRSFKLVYKNWWITFGIIMIMVIIITVLGSLFSIPSIIITVVQGYFTMTGDGGAEGQSLALIVATFLGSIGQYLVYPISLVGIGIQYFNLKEQKENPELFQKISEITGE